jgi:hypothetical protein
MDLQDEETYGGVATDDEIEMLRRDLCPCLPCIDKSRLMNRIDELKRSLGEATDELTNWRMGRSEPY